MATTTKAVAKKATKKRTAPATARHAGAAEPAVEPVIAPLESVAIALDALSDAKHAKHAGVAGGAKQKLVRDSFTMPKGEYALLDSMKQRMLARSKAVKKSELLRAGVATLAMLSDDALLEAMGRVESLKTGRPKK